MFEHVQTSWPHVQTRLPGNKFLETGIKDFKAGIVVASGASGDQEIRRSGALVHHGGTNKHHNQSAFMGRCRKG